MRYWYDTEFVDNGRTIDLISIGVVAEDGREYYAVNADADWRRVVEHKWLVENVWPYLPIRRYASSISEGSITEAINYAHPDVKPKEQIAQEITGFLVGDRDTTELWAYFAAYDHVALAQLFGRMKDLPDHVPIYSHDLKQEVDRVGFDVYTIPNKGAHNALEDARWNKAVYDALGNH